MNYEKHIEAAERELEAITHRSSDYSRTSALVALVHSNIALAKLFQGFELKLGDGSMSAFMIDDGSQS